MRSSNAAPEGGYPRGGLHGQVVHAIGRQIVEGAIQPGELLPAQAGVPASRTVLREAIKVLAAKGLVESRPKTGTRVRPRQAWNLLDPDVLAWQGGTPSESFLRKLTEVRRIVEPAAAELAALRAQPADVAALGEAYQDMEGAMSSPDGDVDAFVAADIRFHRAILNACQNDLLEQMSRVVYDALALSFDATSRLPGRAKTSLPNHRAILEAIRDQDAPRAARVMRRLVHNTAGEIEALREPERARR